MAFGLATALAWGWLLAFYFTSLEKQRSAMKKRIRRLLYNRILQPTSLLLIDL
jgi:hypothetical protein